ncbi:MAG: sensor histidine kinase [Agathobacter sp.]
MTVNQVLQISLEIWGALFCAISGIAVWLGQNTRSETIIVRMEFMVAFLLVMDALAWGFRGYPGYVGYCMVRVSNFAVFILNYLVMLEFSRYVVSIIGDKGDFPVNTWIWAIYMLVLTALALVIVNLFTGTFYSFDADNFYYRTGNYYILMLIGLVGSMLNTMFLIINAKNFSPKMFWSLLSYLVLPTASGAFQLFHYGISLINISMGLSLLFIFFSWMMDRVERQARQETQLMEQKAKMAEQEREIANMQQDLMLSQIQPHFLYNSLTAIAQLCESNPTRAKTATISFADYLRGNMDALKSKEPIPFSKELEHIENYLYLEQIRFGKDLEVIYDIETVDFRVPVLSVQPLVENAVKHGIKRRGTVVIRSMDLPDAYEVEIIDDGIGFRQNRQQTEDGRSHIGIQSVRSRLKEMCNGELSYVDTPGGGTTAIVRIPKPVEK